MTDIADALAAHADATTLYDAIIALICAEMGASSDNAMAETEDHPIVTDVLAHLETRPMTIVHAVATVLAENTSESGSDEIVDRLFMGLLHQMKQRLDDTEEATVPVVLIAVAQRMATELTRDEPTPERLKVLGGWADAVVDMAVRIATNASTASPEAPVETELHWVVRLANEFFRVHQHSRAIQNDFRIMTLVWKNLNKLSAVHRLTILQHGGDEVVHRVAATSYTFTTAFEAAAASFSRTTQRLRSIPKGHKDQAIAGDLRMLRLFLRAFQGHYVQFVDSMVAQVECSVALAIDAIAAVIPIAETFVTQSEKTQHEAMRVLQCVISFVETMGRSDKVQASTRSYVGTLLWQSSEKMITLVKQTRSQYVDVDDSIAESRDSFLQSGHLLALASFFAVHGDVDDSVSIVGSTIPEFASVAALFSRFEEWGERVLMSEFSKTISVLIDIVLDLLVAHAPTTKALQIFLTEQTLLPNPTRRFLLWAFWRELMCFIWEDEIVRIAFNTLIELTYTRTSIGETLDTRVRGQVLSLLGYIYPEVCGTVKQEYLRIVSSAFDVVCAEGPNHKLTPELATSFDLLEILAGSSLLVEYEEANKEDWIAHYLPVAMELVGGLHDLLDQEQSLTLPQKCGVLRALDAGLLIIRAIFEDNDASDTQNAQGLGGMVVPMCTETVTHLAKMSQLSNGDQSSSSPVLTRSFTRVLRNCLEILTSSSPLLKANRSNQCVQLIKDLFMIVQSDHELTPHAAAIAIFFRDALGDMQVMPSDADAVWKILGYVFHKLSALNFGLQVDPAVQPLTPPQSMCLEAIYTVLARSNLPELASRQRNFKSWMVSHAQPRFAKYIQMMCNGAQAAEAVKTKNCEQWCRTIRTQDQSTHRNPSFRGQDTGTISNKRRREDTNALTKIDLPPRTVSVEDVDMDEEIENAKRIKWDSFATTYWQLHDSLSSLTSPDLQEEFLNRLTEKDLDLATTALQNLLKKNQSQ